MTDILHPENVGHWKLTEYAWTCSVCGYELNPKRGQTPDKSDSCPFCAARMEDVNR